MKNIALILVFCLFIGIFSVGSFIAPDRDLSENENRPLAQFPEITAEGVAKGRVQADLNTWFSDQLLWRDGLIAGKTRFQKLVGKRDVGDVYICRDGFYVEKTTESEIDTEILENNLQAVDLFFKNSGLEAARQNLMLVPPAGYILKDKLPDGAAFFDYEGRRDAAKSLKNGSFVDLTAVLKSKGEENYYKTDHHWTTDGAFSAYKHFCKIKGIEPLSFQKTLLSDSFLGTLHAKALDSDAKAEEIYSYRRKGDEDYRFSINGKVTDFGIYDESKLATKDKYGYFFGGNYGISTVENCGGEGHLLVIKDSFANSFLPFLLPHYGKVTIIDPRFFIGSMSELLKTEDVTDILVLYGMETFISDKNVPVILG